jgi:transcriptional regulator with AAA-type ATPase domain
MSDKMNPNEEPKSYLEGIDKNIEERSLIHSKILLTWFEMECENLLKEDEDIFKKFTTIVVKLHQIPLYRKLAKSEDVNVRIDDVNDRIDDYFPQLFKDQFDSLSFPKNMRKNRSSKVLITASEEIGKIIPGKLYKDIIGDEISEGKSELSGNVKSIHHLNLNIVDPYKAGKFNFSELFDNLKKLDQELLENNIFETEVFLNLVSKDFNSFYFGFLIYLNDHPTAPFKALFIHDKNELNRANKIDNMIQNFDKRYGIADFDQDNFLPFLLRGKKVNIYDTGLLSPTEAFESELISSGISPEVFKLINDCNLKNPDSINELEILSAILDEKLPILLLGETGVGKTYIADKLHMNSKRKIKDMIQLNCASIPENLIESELFGSEKGAFTGAIKKDGYVAQAKESTLFLDEITEAPLGLQAKLLTFIETGEYYKVGGTDVQKSDVRLIFSSNRKIQQSIKNGRLRPDFYYRIATFTLHIPPIRKRGREIISIGHSALLEAKKHFSTVNIKISDKTLLSLLKYQWPGNLRQMINTFIVCLVYCRVNKLYEVDEKIIKMNYKEELGINNLEEFEENIEQYMNIWNSRKNEIHTYLKENNLKSNNERGMNFLDGFIKPIIANVYSKHNPELKTNKKIFEEIGIAHEKKESLLSEKKKFYDEVIRVLFE